MSWESTVKSAICGSIETLSFLERGVCRQTVNLFSACSRETDCSVCQPSPDAFDAFARNRGVNSIIVRHARPEHQNHPRYAARLEKTRQGSAGEPINSEPGAGAKQIADRVRRLHRRNDAELCEPRDVDRMHNLRVSTRQGHRQILEGGFCDAGLAGLAPPGSFRLRAERL